MKGIGGYNQISITDYKTLLHPGAFRFQSARAALYAYIKSENIKTLYIPSYMCDSLYPALESLGISIEFYSLNDSLLPKRGVYNQLSKSSRVLLVNYFGLLTREIELLVSKQPEEFIVDNSQALFSDHLEGTTSIYSPRKFLGIPDGGLLKTNSKVPTPVEYFDSSPYIGHLLLRAAGSVSEGYSQFLVAEQALDDFIPKKMSIISSYLFEHTNLNEIIEKRRRNYCILQGRFSGVNQLNFPLYAQVPLCYPLKINSPVESICKDLVKKSIFLPRYWNSKYNESIGRDMFEKTLFMPIDERLSEQDIELLINSVAEALDLR